MNKKKLKTLQDFTVGKDVESHILRELIMKQLTDSSKLQMELIEQRERNSKLAEENNFLHKLLLENMNEKALLINEKNHLIEQAKNQTIGAREQRLINVAKSLIIELEKGNTNYQDQNDTDLEGSGDQLDLIKMSSTVNNY